MIGKPASQLSWNLPKWLRSILEKWAAQEEHIYPNFSSFLTNKLYGLAKQEVPHLVREALSGNAPADGSQPVGRRAPRATRAGGRNPDRTTELPRRRLVSLPEAQLLVQPSLAASSSLAGKSRLYRRRLGLLRRQSPGLPGPSALLARTPAIASGAIPYGTSFFRLDRVYQ